MAAHMAATPFAEKQQRGINTPASLIGCRYQAPTLFG
jgi:hypothetical protein